MKKIANWKSTCHQYIHHGVILPGETNENDIFSSSNIEIRTSNECETSPHENGKYAIEIKFGKKKDIDSNDVRKVRMFGQERKTLASFYASDEALLPRSIAHELHYRPDEDRV